MLIFSCLCISLLALAVARPLHARYEKPVTWWKFKGAWFEIKYPTEFAVLPSLPNNQDERNGYDSAFFVSPEKTVEFYVFSPLCDGEPKDIAFDKENEDKTYEETKERDGYKYNWYTIKDKENTYTRTYIDVIDTVENNCRHVLGIKYTNRKAYDKYKFKYTFFKDSLVQYWHKLGKE